MGVGLAGGRGERERCPWELRVMRTVIYTYVYYYYYIYIIAYISTHTQTPPPNGLAHYFGKIIKYFMFIYREGGRVTC